MTGRLVRLAEQDRAAITLTVDGAPIAALEGDTVMTAILLAQGHLRESEFGDGLRAGMCLMGACQDCWVWTGDGGRLRACGTPAADGMAICTRQPDATWPNLG